MAADTIIACGKGHVFWGSWVPGASVTTIRLGPRRLGMCKVGRHLSLLRRVDESELTPEQRGTLFDVP
ncbi:hypothetical protein ACOBQB_07800 [Streptomyces sp. G5(2025)]|uniref:hypothetical protein n=1 Tax=Streptomyces sp. G5(2025) TaxID=3406628 RepID=UPI003C180EAA